MPSDSHDILLFTRALYCIRRLAMLLYITLRSHHCGPLLPTLRPEANGLTAFLCIPIIFAKVYYSDKRADPVVQTII